MRPIGKGPFGKGVGKGVGKRGVFSRRHAKSVKSSLDGVTKASIRKLARRGGVKRLSSLIYDETRKVLVDFLKDVIGTSILYTEHARRKTVTVTDVIYALKKRGKALYGF